MKRMADFAPARDERGRILKIHFGQAEFALGNWTLAI